MQYTERPEYTYDYHWGRIVFALVALTCLAAGIYAWLGTNQDTQPAPGVAPTVAAESIDATEQENLEASAINTGADPIKAPSAKPVDLQDDAASQEGIVADNTALEEDTPDQALLQEAPLNAKAAVNEPPQPELAAEPVIVKAEITLESDAPAPAPTPKAKPADIQPDKANEVVDTRTKAKLFTAAIKRAKLTAQVSQREPGVALPTQITLEENGLSKVYFYTEVIGQSGKTHYHHWYHNGKLKAKVPITIGSDRWRCYSSKYLNHQQTGKWTVKVIDAKNRLLAQSQFDFTAN